MKTFAVALAFAGLMLAATPSAAQNLLVNPTFTSNITGWMAGGAFDPTLDASGAPPGSAMLLNSSADANTSIVMIQCVNGVIPGATYAFGGSVRLSRPAGQLTNGDSRIGIVWHPIANCPFFNAIGDANTPFVNQLDAWLPINGSDTAPAGAASVGFFLTVGKDEAGGSFQGNFDDVFLQLQSAVPALGGMPIALVAFALAMTAWLSLRNAGVNAV